MTALTVHNAEIRTATVEVKTLTISGRQVTQAVFKQLPERPLIADDGTLHGKPWGHVNYHPGKCADSDRHLHVVWQLRSELFRARVDLDMEHPRWLDTEAASRWIDAKVRDDAVNLLTGWTPMKTEFTKSVLGLTVRMFMSKDAQKVTGLLEHVEAVRRAIADSGPGCSVPAVSAEIPAPHGQSGRSAAMAAARAAAARAVSRRMPAPDALSELQRQLDTAAAALPATSVSEAEKHLTFVVQEELDRRRRHSDARRALTALPQLFIAAG